MITVLADCQRILKRPGEAWRFVQFVACYVTPKTVEIPEDIANLKSVERARKLGIGIRFVKDAPPSGEIRESVYEHVFVYPLYKRNSERWAAPFGQCLSRAIDKHVGESAKRMTKRSWDDDEDDADCWKKGATC
jgi:hypothetical protein